MNLTGVNKSSLLAGTLGAVLAAVWVFVTDLIMEVYPPLNTMGITLPAGIVSGLFSGFFFFRLYYRLIGPREQSSSLGLYRAMFGGLAGAVSGLITGIAHTFSYDMSPYALADFFGSGLFGTFLGGITGAVAALIFGSLLERTAGK
jgi:membrane-associated PAP2 superfamily phosphatase